MIQTLETYENGKLVKTEKVEVPDSTPTLDDRLAAIEDAITNASDFAAMKVDLVAAESSAVEAQPVPKK